ncbi:MAG: MBOAT family O-acyltransferase [Planctomycetota bacterium]|nr:MBOAT family O-acyltransferase [Planctomycetota bacterium]
MHSLSLWSPLFLVAVMGAYYALQPGRRYRGQNWLLLVASYIVYSWFDWTYCLALATSTLANFAIAKRIHHAEGQARRRWLTASLVFNLGVLCYFKYLGFLVDSATGLLASLGMEMSWSVTHLWLPLGISFFTFQNLGYTLDVYKGRIKPVEQWQDFALFVAFFPQLIMGPIERAAHLMPQIQAPRTPTVDSLQRGAWLVFLGLTKKILIADQIGILVAPLFEPSPEYLAGDVAIGALLFTLQIYADFAGYTDIVRGTGKMFGFELSRNFKVPYLARNIRDFWARWHITLSSWVNEYVFMSLAVNPRWNRRLRTSGLLIVTMVTMGAWHGAGWMFLSWGLYHGILLALYHRSRPYLNRRAQFETPTGQRAFHVASIILTFSLVTFGELLFRPSNIDQSMAMYRGLLTNYGLSATAFAALLVGVRAYGLIFLLDILEERTGDDEAILKWHWIVRRPLQLAMCYFLLESFAYGESNIADFHYFRF